MELQYTGLAHTLQTAAIAALIFVVCAFLPKLNYKSQLAKLPIFGGSSSGEKQRQAYLSSAKKMYIEGYEKFKDSVYRIASSDGEDSVVVPTSLLPELRKLPDDVLSFPRAVDKTMETKYTKLLTESHLVVHSVRSDLTPALGRMNPIVREEVDTCVDKYMPDCSDWTEVYIYKTIVDIVAQVSGRVFVGPGLCEDPEYLDCATNYTMDLIDSVTAIKQLRPWLRPFMAPRTPEIRRLRQREKKLTEYLHPLIRQRREAAKDPNWEKPDDMTQWMLDRSEGENMPVEQYAQCQLGLIFAAIHTTSLTATNIFYTLAATPEYIGPLRDEIRSVLAEHNGEITTKALQQMEKLDSYMKEVNRFFPPGMTSFGRRVLKGITLSNGQYIPPGVVVEVPSVAVYSDSALWPDSGTFDGLRHYKLRRSGAATDHARNQFVTTNEQNLAFGYGRHACPGRFFAANEIKMIVAKMVLEYDIKMPDGLTERYAQIEIGRNIAPNPTKALLFRKVQV
ncbi:cytochrome P450 monooxygenase-like protein [Boeremia exigua]|uniref:cytochrome P450 monooxygenase-like protein n=1 Tax=Boeremia exigua TaxID=749465 RepID=UPI001E8CB61C|nr:cytochrome P450 monooxygenase-like protein [Boeremia exigua]KAH6618782.1 cytochrome P450 monooxygenase-like protein [Boeremia exigua]